MMGRVCACDPCQLYAATHHWNCLIETVLVRGRNICFHWEIGVSVFGLSPIPHLARSAGYMILT